MIHPRFKIFGILLGVLLISSSFMGCNISKSATPLSLEEIHSIMSEERPEWTFEADIESATEEKQVYWTKNEEGIPICMIVSTAYGGENQLGLNLFSRAYNDPEYEWEDYLRLASKLYGHEQFHEQFKDEFKEYALNRDASLYGNGFYRKRVDDIHVDIQLDGAKDTELGYTIASIVYVNSETYEKNKTKEYKYLKDQLRNLDLNVIEAKNISDIKAQLDQAKDESLDIFIQGTLTNFKEVNEVAFLDRPISFQVSTYPKEYFKADFTDGAETIEVICIKSSLTKEELGQVRTHYIHYSPKEDIYLLERSYPVQN